MNFFTMAPKTIHPDCATRKAGTPDPQAGAPGLLGVLQEYACGALGRAPGQDGVFDASLQKPMHSPGCGGADIVAELV